MSRLEKRLLWTLAVAVLFLMVLPLWLAGLQGGEGAVFGGVLLNPLDDNTYLAKMVQGRNGAWRFTLPYTAQPGDGAYINVYYLFLGHLAGGLNLPNPVVYHAARLAATLLLLPLLLRFYRRALGDPGAYRVALVLSALGSGLGWLLIPFQQIPADFWVAETYPFLSAMTNPHFPLGLALVVWLVTPSGDRSAGAGSGRQPIAAARLAAAILVSFMLAIISPFGVAIALLAWGGVTLSRLPGALRAASPGATRVAAWIGDESVLLPGAIMLGGLPVLVYDWVAIRSDPVLSGWNAQNLTMTPPWWDILLSLSPALLLAVPGLWMLAKKGNQGSEILISWAVLGLLAVAVPFSLQRRFMMGLYIPLAGLAAAGLQALIQRRPGWRRMLTISLFVLALPTNLILIAGLLYGINSRDPALYLYPGEALAFEWIQAQTDADALILASPAAGLLIPGHTGRRVIYGHPFETVDAVRTEAQVLSFFSGRLAGSAADFYDRWGVEYVFYGPREQQLGPSPDEDSLVPVYDHAQVVIFRVIE